MKLKKTQDKNIKSEEKSIFAGWGVQVSISDQVPPGESMTKCDRWCTVYKEIASVRVLSCFISGKRITEI